MIKDAIPDILEMLRDEDENTSVRTAALESLVRSSKQGRRLYRPILYTTILF